eukprot:m.187782 g.187782  ORF g.187782 m.187782 type:complete len:100 (+) comp16715_c1_seq8:4544-4843(+)
METNACGRDAEREGSGKDPSMDNDPFAGASMGTWRWDEQALKSRSSLLVRLSVGRDKGGDDSANGEDGDDEEEEDDDDSFSYDVKEGDVCRWCYWCCWC